MMTLHWNESFLHSPWKMVCRSKDLGTIVLITIDTSLLLDFLGEQRSTYLHTHKYDDF